MRGWRPSQSSRVFLLLLSSLDWFRADKGCISASSLGGVSLCWFFGRRVVLAEAAFQHRAGSTRVRLWRRHWSLLASIGAVRLSRRPWPHSLVTSRLIGATAAASRAEAASVPVVLGERRSAVGRLF